MKTQWSTVTDYNTCLLQRTKL